MNKELKIGDATEATDHTGVVVSSPETPTPYLNHKSTIERRGKRLEELGVTLCRRENGSWGIEWPGIDEDLLSFRQAVKLLWNSRELPDEEFRLAILPKIFNELSSSPSFQFLSNVYGSRQESTLEHSRLVAEMVVTDGLESKFWLRLMAVYHDIGKGLISDIEAHSELEGVRYKISPDSDHDHAVLSFSMLQELIVRASTELQEMGGFVGDNPGDFVKPVKFHHILEAMALGKITPEELVQLIGPTSKNFLNTLPLMLADMGAAGKLNYFVENIDALLHALEVSNMSIEEQQIINDWIAIILPTVLERMLVEEPSLDNLDLQLSFYNKVQEFIKTLLINVEEIAKDSEDRDELRAILSQALLALFDRIEGLAKKYEYNMKELYKLLLEIIGNPEYSRVLEISFISLLAQP